MRAIWSSIKLIILILWSLFSILCALIVIAFTFNRKIPVIMARKLWAPPAIFIVGGRIQKPEGIENINKKVDYLVMANHSSYLDIPMLFRSLPINLYFIGKKELKKVPFLGWYMKLCGMIFIDRQNPKKARQSLADAVTLIKKGGNVVIFPEGTTSSDGKLAPFKKGGFVMAHDCQNPILPVKIEGTFDVWPSDSNMSLKRGKVKIKVGEPIPYEDYKDIPPADLAKKVHEIIAAI